MIAQTPELADGGYWYVVPVSENLALSGPGWCAWFGTDFAVARVPDPVPGVEPTSAAPAEVLLEAGLSHKVRARIEGR